MATFPESLGVALVRDSKERSVPIIKSQQIFLKLMLSQLLYTGKAIQGLFEYIEALTLTTRGNK